MKRSLVATLIFLGSLLVPLTASADTIRAYIADFTVSPADSGDLKNTLKRLFASRLSGEGLNTVDSAAEADVIISGSYTMLGRMFSLDAFAKSASGKQLAAAYEQGESIDALIPAVGKLSAKLKGDVARQYQQAPAAASAPPVQAPSAKTASADIVRSEPASGWISQRIAGAKSALATWGTSEILVADEEVLQLYRQGAKLALVTEAKIPESQKVLGIDAIGPDIDGKVLVFVTTLDKEAPASRIYAVQNDTLTLVAQDLPYMFRTLAPYGEAKKLYAQQMGRSDDYYGDVFEAAYVNGAVRLSNPIKMPRFGNIFNFNMFRDQSGKSYLTVFNDSGYLIVYTDAGEELWRSSEKFGGTETYFQRRDSENERVSGTPFRTRFIDQRITVTDRGEIIVPQNAGFFVLGNQRSYSRYSMVSFAWNGSSLEELWRTKASQNYLADYAYHPESRDLVLLEVTQKRGLAGKGGSLVRITRP